MSLFGSPNVEKLKAKRDIPGLVKALDYQKDPQVRQDAALALGTIGDPQAVAALLAALKQGDEPTREAATRALGQAGAARAVEPLIAALSDPAPSVRRAAVAGLAHLSDPRAIEPLIALLRQPDETLSPEIVQALAQIGAALRKGGTGEGEEETTRLLVNPLAALLQDQDEAPRTRQAAATALEQVGWQPAQDETSAAYWIVRQQWERSVAVGEPAVPYLVAALTDQETTPEARQAIFRSLVQIGPSSAPALIALLKHAETDVRKAAVHALVSLGASALPSLIEALHDEHEEVRLAVVIILGQIGDPRAVVPLIGRFQDTDWTVRGQAYKTIVRIGKPAIPQLVAALRHESDEIKWGAAGTLEALGWKPAADETGAIYWIVKGEWHRCVSIGAPAISPLIARLTHWDTAVCREAMGSLVRLGGLAVEPLIAALTDEHPNVRKCAATALGMIGDKRGEQPLMQLLSDRDREVSKIASEAISAIQTGEMWRGSS
jgi:HEAT repeat protein